MVIEIKRNAPLPARRKKVEDRRGILAIDPFEDMKDEATAPPKPKRAPNGTFNRTEYQRLYMQAKREMKLAGVEGMTVKQWRDSQCGKS